MRGRVRRAPLATDPLGLVPKAEKVCSGKQTGGAPLTFHMPQALKTLAAIDAYCKDNQKADFRRHLGASQIGKPCTRAIWYGWRWTKKKLFEGQMVRLFERGQRYEDRFFNYLRAVGCEVWEFENPEKKTQWKISDVEGHLGGSLDGVGRGLPDLPPEMPFHIECKTHNLKSFTSLVEDGLMKSKWEHYVQCQTYREKMGLPVSLYMAECKDNDKLYLELVWRDPVQAQRTIDRARLIIYAHEAPPKINKSSAYYICKWCEFSQICHFKKTEQIERNCRTCQHSRPLKDGSGNWECTLSDLTEDNEILNEEKQLAACPHYQLSPGLTSEP